MASYLLDAICAGHYFPGMTWEWLLTEPPIHIYYNFLWEHEYNANSHKICNKFFALLTATLTCESVTCLSKQARKVLEQIGYWYVKLMELTFIYMEWSNRHICCPDLCQITWSSPKLQPRRSFTESVQCCLERRETLGQPYLSELNPISLRQSWKQWRA